ncbi:MAG: hypothetical protein KatS3mg016_1446 [Fimbriimonadales bacterium]|nr:MAG: hypothetical protein KatS3mg016_1446 [Fimbriimonadales bacterium]
MVFLKHALKQMLSPLSSRWVYTARSGLAKGMRIKGGFLFLPKPIPKESAVLEAIAPSLTGKVVYDIGANIGITTLFFARAVGEQGLVVAFEPVPPTAQRLRDNVQINRLDNVRVYELALGDEEAQAEISYAAEASGIATLRQDLTLHYQKNYYMQSFQIEVVPLDVLLKREQLPLPDFIKMDVEGFEWQVLRGAQKILKEAHPQLFLELHGASREERYQTWLQIYQYLTQLGYAIVSVNQQPITPNNLLDEGNLWFCTPH